jgi:predicted dehydrogenase/diketogulonate reductase-like aldo/keto reductase
MGVHSMNSVLNWGILATGRIAGIFATGVARSGSGRLVAVGSRGIESAARFAAEFKVPRAQGSYEALLADPEVQAVYIATPHPQHVEWVIKAAEAGKHVLCEKPIGLNHADAMVAAEACRRNGVLLMEAFMYRCHPQTAKIVELVKTGALGKVGVIQATFGFNAGLNAESRLWANRLGGGGILDVGCYATSMSRLVAGAAAGQPFAEPVAVSGAGHLHPQTGVDVQAAATLKFADGIVAQVATSIGVSQQNSLRIYGTEGWLDVPSPWIPAPDGGPVTMTLHKGGGPQVITTDSPSNLYSLEADAVAAALAAGQKSVPQMPVADTLGNMAVLDQWRQAIGLVYESEKPAAFTRTFSGRPLARKAAPEMLYGEVEGLPLPVSRLIMGVDNQPDMPHAAAMFDDYYERGGNTFDTAWVYGSGSMEKLLGQWIRNRGVRNDVLVIAKGAHTPCCTPEWLTTQLNESLERLQTDRADLYFMHRDNPEVPVGEFVDVLNEHVRAGRIRVFGGSNWSLDRVSAANRYAKRKGLQGFGAVSNNFSLARMIEAPWAGCVSSSDPESRRWFKRTGIPLFAWSSQAAGFFTARFDKGPDSEPWYVRSWYSEDNWKRRERAYQLAAKKGVAPTNIAAAYVLSQPFRTFALFGPRQLSETAVGIEALKLTLTPREIRWLDEG